MTAAEPPKVAVVGAVEGQLRKAFKKLSKFQENGISFCIVVGDLFGHGSDASENAEINELLDGSLTVPLPTYFTIGDSPLPERIKEKLEINDTVCPNLFYLGRKGTLKTSDGIRIVFLGGKLVQNDSSVTHALGRYDPLFLEADVKGLIGAHSADILVTNQWPAGITNGSQNEVPDFLQTNTGIPSIAELCTALKPRYHFSSTPKATWEREAFTHSVEYGSFEAEPITRFRSLASLDIPKQWAYPFKLDPTGPPPAAPDATVSPFSRPKKRPAYADQAESYSRYGDSNQHQHARSRKKSRPDQCFFCFNDPEFNSHMVASLGEESLLTVPKGPLPLPSTFPSLPSSGHVLIIPFYHAGLEEASGPRSDEEVSPEFEEMTTYRKSLCKMIQSKSKGTLGAICWDTNRSGVRHMHWQFIPAPAAMIREGIVEAAFKAYREKHEYPPFQSCNSDRPLAQKSDYFRLWIWTSPEQSASPVDAADRVRDGEDEGEGSEKSIYFPLPGNQRFNFQFGRDVMARVLQLGNRVRWQDVEQSHGDEERDAKALSESLRPYGLHLPDGRD